jgi:hypothetical protein
VLLCYVLCMSLSYQTVRDQDGTPTAALIPWNEFVELMESSGLDLPEIARDELREALRDSDSGIRSAFVREDDV